MFFDVVRHRVARLCSLHSKNNKNTRVWKLYAFCTVPSHIQSAQLYAEDALCFQTLERRYASSKECSRAAPLPAACDSKSIQTN